MHRAFDPPPTDPPLFVTHAEYLAGMKLIDVQIANAELKMRNWVLAGLIAILIMGVGGYVSIVTKLDRLVEALPGVDRVLEGRRPWMLRKDERDGQQDHALKSLLPDYQPAPYVEPPK